MNLVVDSSHCVMPVATTTSYRRRQDAPRKHEQFAPGITMMFFLQNQVGLQEKKEFARQKFHHLLNEDTKKRIWKFVSKAKPQKYVKK